MGLDRIRKSFSDAMRDCYSHSRMIEVFSELGMPPEPDIPRDDQPWNSKATYALWRFSLVPDESFLVLAEKIARQKRLADLLDEVFEAQDEGLPPLDEVCRRRIAEQYVLPETIAGLRSLESLFGEFSAEFAANIDFRIFSFDLSGKPPPSIDESFGKTDTLALMKQIRAFSWSRRRFLALVERSLEPRSRPPARALDLRNRLAPIMAESGWTMIDEGADPADPRWRIVPLRRGVGSVVKNLVFASKDVKPEFGFRDAVSNDIEILSGAEHCLIFDRPLPRAGLLWRHLVDWWAEKQGIGDDALARKSLGDRLSLCLDSDGEKNLFMEYFHGFRDRLGPRLPALVPQVYLHYDPKTISQLRGRKRYPRQRMDFLMLLPNGARIVIEVDGKHHYANEDGTASTKLYAEMVSADRDLKLNGYEVYRFGASELCGYGSADRIRDFFERLLGRHGIL